MQRITVYARPGRVRECIAPLQGLGGQGNEEISALPSSLERSETGAVVFGAEGSAVEGHGLWGSPWIILPPFPVERDQRLEGWDVAQLRSILARSYVLGVVLLRLGRFAVAVYRGQVLETSRTGTRFVKGRHSAGGQSQTRFQRVREKQIQEIFKKACSVVREQFAPLENELDYIFLGGERLTLQGFVKSCQYLQKLSPRIMGGRLNVRTPNRQSLDKVIDTIWESRLLTVEGSSEPDGTGDAWGG